MILRAWSGALIDTAKYPWTIWPRWAMGWLRFAWAHDPPRCRARSETGRRCWERREHHGPHWHEYLAPVLRQRRADMPFGAPVLTVSYEPAFYRWVETDVDRLPRVGDR